MGLKESLKKAWKRVTNLEDEAASESGQSTQNVRIPYKNISKKIKEIMKKNVDVVGRKILIPNYYAIYFGETDRKARREVEDILCDELREELYYDMRKINPEQNKREIVIEIKTDSSLEKGKFRIEHHLKKPSQEESSEEVVTSQPAPPVPDPADDYKATGIEQVPDAIPGDEQETVVEKATSGTSYKIFIDSGTQQEEKIITQEKITIGRSSKDDVVLESSDFSISRSHATITIKEGEHYLLASGVNGVIMNGDQLELQKEVKISPGDEFKIMNYTLKIIV